MRNPNDVYLLGLDDDKRLLQQTLDEEGETDHHLTDLAERVINIEALRGSDREAGRRSERAADSRASSGSSRRPRRDDSEAVA